MTLERLVVDAGPDDRLADVVASVRAIVPGSTLAERRTGAEWDVAREAAVLADEGVMVEEREIPGPDGPVPVQVITPPGDLVDGTLVGFHGGGYVLCSAATHALRFARMAQAAGCRLVNVDYPLAPEHPFPAAVRAAEAATVDAAASGPTVLVGDSAGGGLELSVALSLRDGLHGAPVGAALPSGLVLISPWTDLTNSAPSLFERRGIDPFAHVDDLPAFAAAYLAQRDTGGHRPDRSHRLAAVRGPDRAPADARPGGLDGDDVRRRSPMVRAGRSGRCAGPVRGVDRHVPHLARLRRRADRCGPGRRGDRRLRAGAARRWLSLRRVSGMIVAWLAHASAPPSTTSSSRGRGR